MARTGRHRHRRSGGRSGRGPPTCPPIGWSSPPTPGSTTRSALGLDGRPAGGRPGLGLRRRRWRRPRPPAPPSSATAPTRTPPTPSWPSTRPVELGCTQLVGAERRRPPRRQPAWTTSSARSWPSPARGSPPSGSSSGGARPTCWCCTVPAPAELAAPVGSLVSLLPVHGPADGDHHLRPALPAPRRDAGAGTSPRRQQRGRRRTRPPSSSTRGTLLVIQPSRPRRCAMMRRLLIAPGAARRWRCSPLPACGSSGGGGGRASQPAGLTLLTYDAFTEPDALDALHRGDRHRRHGGQGRRRRHAGQQGHPHRRAPRGRRPVGRRQHPAVAGASARTVFDALRVARAGPAGPGRRRPRARPRGDAGRHRRRLPERRHAAGSRTTGLAPPTSRSTI